MTSLPPLSGPSVAPASGRAPKQLVVLLHGLGADGHDLLGLSQYWAAALPDAEFLAPHAPHACDMAPMGYQWFSLRDYNMAKVTEGVRAAGPVLNAFLDKALAERGLRDRDMALVGFSQGTMMSLHVAPRRANPCACIVGFSGALIDAETLAAQARSRPPVLLVHGDQDPVVPFQAMGVAESQLKALGVAVESNRRPGLGHSIDEVGLDHAARFMRHWFGLPPAY
ncbi:MAG TPA: dienelactone hydrolase family protein [Alphaproteobacteria bacterium]|nr:dienelactone hydrolase family protein [Alphaproteobacteria bacterium]